MAQRSPTKMNASGDELAELAMRKASSPPAEAFLPVLPVLPVAMRCAGDRSASPPGAAGWKQQKVHESCPKFSAEDCAEALDANKGNVNKAIAMLEAMVLTLEEAPGGLATLSDEELNAKLDKVMLDVDTYKVRWHLRSRKPTCACFSLIFVTPLLTPHTASLRGVQTGMVSYRQLLSWMKRVSNKKRVADEILNQSRELYNKHDADDKGGMSNRPPTQCRENVSCGYKLHARGARASCTVRCYFRCEPQSLRIEKRGSMHRSCA